MNIHSLQIFLEKTGEPKYRLKQIKKAIYEGSILNFDKITTIPENLRDTLSENFRILSFEEENIFKQTSNTSLTPLSAMKCEASQKEIGAAKSLLQFNDGNKIETVILPNENGWTACISSQAGCALGCKFCATGKMGFKRNLTSEEITDQILYWKGFLNNLQKTSLLPPDCAGRHPQRRRGAAPLPFKVMIGAGLKNSANWRFPSREYRQLTSIVYMGMGEPFLNWENTKKSLEDLTNKDLFGFGSRSISVSTAGIPDGIINFAKNFPQMNLAVSLHSANDKKRSELMPINKKHSLYDLKNAIAAYFKITNRKIFIEYLMLDGINDSIHDAEELKKFISSLGKKNLLQVNLIAYNETENNFNPSPKIKIKKFEEYLLKNNIHATIRKSLGKEIKGACGQLGS